MSSDEDENLGPSNHDDDLGKSKIGNRTRFSGQVQNQDVDLEVHDKAHSATKEYLEHMKRDSPFFENKEDSKLPVFDTKEVTLGNVLGQGEFGIVYTITAFHVDEKEDASSATPESSPQNNTEDATSSKSETEANGKESASSLLRKMSSVADSDSSAIIRKPATTFGRKDSNVSFAQNPVAVIYQEAAEDTADDSSLSDDDLTENGGSDGIVAKSKTPRISNVSKSYMNSHVIRDGNPRYCVKRLRNDLRGEKLMYSISDFASEARFLSQLRHPNICKMRGTIGTPGMKTFCIILDRLTMTLRDKMMEWKKEDEHGGLISKLGRLIHHDHHKEDEELNLRKEQYKEKLLALYDTARALRFLAKNSIIFRDLKPENLAYDYRGDVRLFDFGLAKELKEKDKEADDMYKLTGATGSRRYMAPEVILCKEYGLPADIYSFAVMFWEVMSNHVAYNYLTNEKHNEMVVMRKKRPNLKKLIPHKNVIPEGAQVHNLVERSWDPKPSNRPNIRTVCDLIATELTMASGGESAMVRDRSIYLVNESLRSRTDFSK